MFERLAKRGAALRRYRTEPYAQERERFLIRLWNAGYSLRRLQIINWRLLDIAARVDLSGCTLYRREQLDEIAEAWAQQTCQPAARSKTVQTKKAEFVFVAGSWLRFLQRLDESERRQPFMEHLEQFLAHLKNDRGFSDATVHNRRRSLGRFLVWLHDRGTPVGDVGPADINDYLANCAACGWSRTTISFHVQSLRSFFRYAGAQGWCPDLSKIIDAPRLYTHESLPQGPSWDDVKRLIASERGDSPVQIRNRAILLLFAVYGFRLGEVQRMKLDDLDWERERILLHRPKLRKTHEYPLTQITGEAILRYLKEVRPRSCRRELFLSLRQPHRPISQNGLSTMVRVRMLGLGFTTRRFGPHSLRHACATHLLAKGFSLKQIGDHLGHVSAAATRIYAKVDLTGLRAVASLEMAELIQHVGRCERSETPLAARGSLAGLRAVAHGSLGGLV